MRKLRLAVEDLAVESFSTAPETVKRGTAYGHQDTTRDVAACRAYSDLVTGCTPPTGPVSCQGSCYDPSCENTCPVSCATCAGDCFGGGELCATGGKISCPVNIE